VFQCLLQCDREMDCNLYDKRDLGSHLILLKVSFLLLVLFSIEEFVAWIFVFI
jgi:hypothetical protein